MSVKTLKVDIGNTIEVGGEHFILVEMIQTKDKPSALVFKQPFELLRETHKGEK